MYDSADDFYNKVDEDIRDIGLELNSIGKGIFYFIGFTDDFDSKTQRKRLGAILDKGINIHVDTEQTPRQSPITHIEDREGNVFQYVDEKPVKIK